MCGIGKRFVRDAKTSVSPTTFPGRRSLQFSSKSTRNFIDFVCSESLAVDSSTTTVSGPEMPHFPSVHSWR